MWISISYLHTVSMKANYYPLSSVKDNRIFVFRFTHFAFFFLNFIINQLLTYWGALDTVYVSACSTFGITKPHHI